MLVRIQVNRDSYYCGLVDWVNKGNIVLNAVGKEGQDMGKSVYKIDDINSIRINDMESRKRLLLYKWRKVSR
ncbi:MAG: hypothetical protein GY756_06125 [bacterium]|nr:hypothetical protein [bacterium]